MKALVNTTYGVLIAGLAGTFGYLQFFNGEPVMSDGPTTAQTENIENINQDLRKSEQFTGETHYEPVPPSDSAPETEETNEPEVSLTPQEQIKQMRERLEAEAAPEPNVVETRKGATESVGTSKQASTPYLRVQSFPTYNKTPFTKSHSFRKIVWTLGEKDGVNYYALANKTISFDNLSRQIAEIGTGKKGHADIHFNKGRGSGPEVLCTTRSKTLAQYISVGLKEIYREQGWKDTRSPSNAVNVATGSFGMLRYGEKHGLHSVVIEFCFVDDPVNGTKPLEFAMTEAGAQRIAQALREACTKAGIDSMTLSIGHWGPRGSSGAVVPSGKYEGMHENEYSIFQINALRKSIPGTSKGPTYKLYLDEPGQEIPKDITDLGPVPNSDSSIATWPGFVAPSYTGAPAAAYPTPEPEEEVQPDPEPTIEVSDDSEPSAERVTSPKPPPGGS